MPSGNRLAVNLFEVVGLEECVEDTAEQKKILRIYLRNGAAFNIQDLDRELLDDIQRQIKYGDLPGGEYATQESD